MTSKITTMSPNSPLTGTERFEIVQSGSNCQMTLSTLRDFMEQTLSSYEVAKQNGFTGTHVEWVNDLATVEDIQTAVPGAVDAYLSNGDVIIDLGVLV